MDTASKARPKKSLISRLVHVVLLGLVGLIWFFVWQQFERARQAAEDPDTPNSQLMSKNARSESPYVNAQPSTVEIMTPEFKSLLVNLEKDFDGLEKDLLQCEQKRIQGDPHLAKALRDPKNTPFAGPQPRLASTILLESRTLIPILVEDYTSNSNHSQEIRAKLAGPIQSTLENYWGGDAPEEFEKIIGIAAASSDPLIAYLNLLQSKPGEEDLQVALSAYQALGLRTVHPLLRAIVCSKLTRLRNQLSMEQYVDACQGATESLADIFQKYQANGPMLQYAFILLDRLEGQLKAVGQITVAMELAKRQKPECPRWVMHYAASTVCSSIADHYRGTDFVSNVPQAQMSMFEEYSQRETNHLLQAWCQASDHPSLTTALMRMEIRAGNTGRSADAWFRHVLSVQLDNSNTLDVYSQYCRPRWGGSDEKLLWLAGKLAECVDIEEDSDAPFFYWWPLNLYCAEHSYAASMSGSEPLKATLRMLEFLKKRPEASPHPRMNGARTAMLLRVLWDAKRLPDVKWVLDHYRKTVKSDELALHRLNLQLMEDICHTAQDNGANSWQTICGDLLGDSQNLADEKIADLEVALNSAEEMASDDPSKRALGVCRRLLDWKKSFQQGAEVSLSFDEHASGWMSSSPLKIIDSQTVEFSSPSNSNSFFMAPMIRFEPPYHFEAEVEITAPGNDMYGIALQVGPHGAQDLETIGMELRFIPGNSVVLWDSHPQNQGIQRAKRVSVKPDMPHTLAIEIDGENSRAYLDAAEVASQRSFLNTHGIVQLGRSARYFSPQPQGSTQVGFRVSNVKIKRLDLSRD